VKLALIGYGNAGRAFAKLLKSQRKFLPARIVAIHTLRHGSAFNPKGLPPEPKFGPPCTSIEEFLDRADADVAIEITTLNPATGEPATSHIRAAFTRRMHVVTANKGPIAHAFAALQKEARRAGVQFRFESSVMDGAPVFNLVRHTLPGCKVLGFTGVLNSTTNVVIEAMRKGRTLADGIAEAQKLGIAEADASYDIDGWDAAAKTAALANVFLNARVTPQDVNRRGIGKLTPQKLAVLKTQGKTIRLIARASATQLRVRPEILKETDILASVHGTSNLVLLETDLMGTIGMVEQSPGVAQTAYGIFSDLADIRKMLR
jgi:homoserine dehydrogenase